METTLAPTREDCWIQSDLPHFASAQAETGYYDARRNRRLPVRLVALSVAGDLIFALVAATVAFWFRFYSDVVPLWHQQLPLFEHYIPHTILACSAVILTCAWFGLYDSRYLLRSRTVSLQLLKAMAAWTCVFSGLLLAFHLDPPISRVYVAITCSTMAIVLLAWRLAFHRFLEKAPLNASLRQRVVFIGRSTEAERLAADFQGPQSAYHVVGWIGTGDDDLDLLEGEPILGASLEEVIARHGVDMVVLADLESAGGSIMSLAAICEREMVAFKVIPSCFPILTCGLHLEMVCRTPVLGVSRLPLDRCINLMIKRAIDIVGATVGLIISIPIIAIFGAIVRLESPGPIFYRQRRLGRDGVPFDLFKIRSMRLDAEADGRVGWTIKDDPRRLKIGAFIRKWNIDELPQFWNVLTGEMSLVGPRPERPELIRNFKWEIPHYNARHAAKPGLTGWAQVKGLRGDTDLVERVRCDIWYLENWSVLLDFQIMFLTLVRHENAC